MSKVALIATLAVYTGILGVAAYMTFAARVATPKVVKRSVRERSVGHRHIHTGIRRGK